ncbi:hypothetical protein AB0C34_30915 [Nocardia sp. NPDC049220]|uniref:hypothetical protein n=1 Tax=Nocardia sp. NPDC049220 TaxID=3155273 RepID=UPI0033EC5F2D
MKHTNNTRTDRPVHASCTDNVIDLEARRRGHLERRGTDPATMAVLLLAETGRTNYWPSDSDSDTDDGGWAA